MRRILLLIGLLAAFGALAAGCGADEPEDDEGASPATTGAAVEQPDPCAKEELTLVNAGRLTIGTDNPAFPPWFEGGTPAGSEWEINDPATGEGFESAVAYAVAEQLGFSEDEVEWMVVPFNLSFRPGPKDFDFDINQVSYVEERPRSRLQRLLLRRQPGGRHARVVGLRRRGVDRGAVGRQARRARGDDELRLHRGEHQAG